MDECFPNTKLLIQQFDKYTLYLETDCESRKELKTLRNKLKQLKSADGGGDNDGEGVRIITDEISMKQQQFNERRATVFPSDELFNKANTELKEYQQNLTSFYENISADEIRELSPSVIKQIYENLLKVECGNISQIQWSLQYIDIIRNLKLSIPPVSLSITHTQSCSCGTGKTNGRYYFYAHETQCRRYMLDQFNRYRKFPNETEYEGLKDRLKTIPKVLHRF